MTLPLEDRELAIVGKTMPIFGKYDIRWWVLQNRIPNVLAGYVMHWDHHDFGVLLRRCAKTGLEDLDAAMQKKRIKNLRKDLRRIRRLCFVLTATGSVQFV